MDVAEMIRLGNVYAANSEWSSAMSMFGDALDVLYASLVQPASPPVAKLRNARRDLYATLEPHRRGASVLDDKEHKAKLFELLSGLPESSGNFQKSLDALAADKLHIAAFPRGFGADDPWTVAFYYRDDVTYPSLGVALSIPKEPDSETEKELAGAYILTDRSLTPVPSREAGRLAYAWAHLASATVSQVELMYRQHQILDGAAIPYLRDAEKLYERALLLNPGYAWALAHRGEVHRDIANCLLGGEGAFHPVDKRFEAYVIAIVYYLKAIKAKENYAWALAHLGAAICNVRAFVGHEEEKNAGQAAAPGANPRGGPPARVKGLPDFDALRVLLDDQQRWPAALTQNEDPQGRTFHRMLDRGMTALVRALDAEGHYYPWAQSYYSASLLLKGIFLRDESDPALAADLAALGQVVSSHAYYLDPRLAVGAFEPAQLAVNPPFEIALVHYWLGFAKFKDGTARKEKNQDPTAIVERAKEDCQRAWASAWIGMQWLFKFHFHAGLQGLAGCRLLQMIADLYCKLLNLVPDTTPPRPARLIEAAKLGGDALSFGISKTPFTSEEEIVDFIRGAVARFCGSSLPPLLIDDVQPNSNVRVGLFAADEFLKGFHRDVGGFATTSKKDALVEELRGWSDRIGKKLRPTPVSSAGGNANQSLAEYEDRSREGFLSIVSFGHFPARSIFNLTNT